jgi:hypothetical protein
LLDLLFVDHKRLKHIAYGKEEGDKGIKLIGIEIHSV